jgi:hypothetical protein
MYTYTMNPDSGRALKVYCAGEGGQAVQRAEPMITGGKDDGENSLSKQAGKRTKQGQTNQTAA